MKPSPQVPDNVYSSRLMTHDHNSNIILVGDQFFSIFSFRDYFPPVPIIFLF